MIRKINFKQPKYIFPLVVFIPLCALVYFVMQTFGGGEDAQQTVATDRINTELPQANAEEAGDKIDASEKAAVQAKIDSLKAVVDRTANQTDISDADIDALKSGKEDLMNAAQKLFQKMYEQTAGAQGAGQQGAGPDMGGAGQSTSGPADDVVDGDYREV